VLTVAAIIDCREPMAWNRALTDITDRLGSAADPVELQIALFIGERSRAHEFLGVRMGHFLTKDNRLTVRVALAEDSPSERHPILLAALEAAVDAAEQHLRRRKVAAGLPATRAVLAGCRADEDAAS
jgi:hypothetical protein